jgi:hypothetical protein
VQHFITARGERVQQNLEEIEKRGNWSADEIAEWTYIIARMEAYRATPRHQADLLQDFRTVD